MTQTQIDIQSLIPEWLRKAEAFDAQARVLVDKANALRQMAESVQVFNGDASQLFMITAPEPHTEESATSKLLVADDVAPAANLLPSRRTSRFDPKDGPRGRDAVRLIVAERPGIWTLKDIKRANARKGWPSPADALGTAVQRLVQDGEGTWMRKGVYRFPPQRSESSAPVSGDGSEERSTGSGHSQ